MKSGIFLLLVNAAMILPLSVSAAASDRLYVYPNGKQSEQQIADDRYQCHRWAAAQTGFNPLDRQLSVPQQPVRVPVADNPSAGATGKGILTGAVLGAAIGAADDHHTGEGAAIGALVGAIAGSVIENRGYQQVRNEAQRSAYREAEARVAELRYIEEGRFAYRRAVSACLEGRNYTVR